MPVFRLLALYGVAVQGDVLGEQLQEVPRGKNKQLTRNVSKKLQIQYF